MIDAGFDHFESLYRELAGSLKDAKDYFSSDEYYSFRQLASSVFAKVIAKCTVFLEIVKGTDMESELDRPEIGRAMCFPRRFLGVSSTALLPEAQEATVNEIIENTFFLGLMCHLLLHSYPTRCHVEKVNVDTFFDEWALNALVADNMLVEYNKAAKEFPLMVYEYYFDSRIKSLLKRQFKMNFFKLAQCRSYFRNLFFSGALLGMQFDLKTQNDAQ